MNKLAAILLAAAFLATACGSSSSPSADSPLAKALADSLMEEPDALTADRAEAECFAGRMVSDIGEDRLLELGVTESNVGTMEEIEFDSSEVEAVVDGMFDCVDVSAMMQEQMEADGSSAEEAKCITDALDEDTLRGLMSSSFGDEEAAGEEFFGEMFEVMATCGLTG